MAEVRLYQNADGTRRATWLELFFDLVFVVAVSALAGILKDDASPHGLLVFTGLFVAVWWQWIDFSYYADQFESHSLSFKVPMFAAMFGVIVLAGTIPDAARGGGLPFAGTMVLLRAGIVALYLRARRDVEESSELAGRYALSFSVALVLWVASCLAAPPLRFGLWGAALAIEIANGPIAYVTVRRVPRQVSHMDERFGLFLLIVLGEAVVSVGEGLGHVVWRPAPFATALAAFLVATALWWMYFSHAAEEAINEALRGGRHALAKSFVYGYAHFFLFAGATACGVGLMGFIEGRPGEGARLALAAGLGAYVLASGLVHWTAPASLTPRELAVRIAAGATVLLLPFASLPPLASVALVALVLWGAIALVHPRTAVREEIA